MVPVSSLPHDRIEHTLVLRYLTEADHLWLESLIGECERFVGRRRADLSERLKEPLAVEAPEDKRRLAAGVLERRYDDRVESPAPPAAIRRALFDARARSSTRAEALERASQDLGLPAAGLEEYLFADLPPERRVVASKAPLSAAELALETNHAMVVSMLKRATVVRIAAEGDVRALVRAAKLRGLLCSATPGDPGRSVRLDISGPYVLFRHTLVYGRALSSLVSRAARCSRFELRALCALRSERDLVELRVRSGDPIVPASPGKPYDSKVEERFARDFAKIAPDWDLLREPEAVPVGGGFIFPDFVLRHRRHRERCYLLEIVGFWTPEYLERKLSGLRRAGIERFVLCVDAARNCADAELPPQARVIRYKRWVDAGEVLRVVEGR